MFQVNNFETADVHFSEGFKFGRMYCFKSLALKHLNFKSEFLKPYFVTTFEESNYFSYNLLKSSIFLSMNKGRDFLYLKL